MAGCLGLALLFSLCGCEKQPVTRSFFAMDTVMQVQVWGPETAADGCVQLVNTLEQKLSVSRPGSQIARLNASGSLAPDADVLGLIRDARALCACSEGALDVTLEPVMELWGFRDGNYAVPEDDALVGALARTGWESIGIQEDLVTLPAGMALDLGAVAKGYTADRLAEQLGEQGVERALLNLGGNVQLLGSKADGSPWRVAVTDPAAPEQAAGTLLLAGSHAVVTSGGYQRYFEEDGVRYHHILDPRTGRPAASGLASVTVVAESGLTADALSTLLFVKGLEGAVEAWQAGDFGPFEAVFITDDGSIFITPGLEDRFETDRACQVVGA